MEEHIPIRPDRSLLLGRQTSKWSYWDVVFLKLFLVYILCSATHFAWTALIIETSHRIGTGPGTTIIARIVHPNPVHWASTLGEPIHGWYPFGIR